MWRTWLLVANNSHFSEKSSSSSVSFSPWSLVCTAKATSNTFHSSYLYWELERQRHGKSHREGFPGVRWHQSQRTLAFHWFHSQEKDSPEEDQQVSALQQLKKAQMWRQEMYQQRMLCLYWSWKELDLNKTRMRCYKLRNKQHEIFRFWTAVIPPLTLTKSSSESESNHPCDSKKASFLLAWKHKMHHSYFMKN